MLLERRTGSTPRSASRYVVLLACLVLTPLGISGCSDSKSSPTKSSPTNSSTTGSKESTMDEATPASQQKPPADNRPVDLQMVDKAEYQKVVDSHRGKVVLVDCWATWCGPCVTQFPHTVDLWEKHRHAGLAVISLSFDDANDPEAVAEVRKFLIEKHATFDNLLSKAPLNAETSDAYEFDGALPHYMVYDRQGKLVEHLSPSDPTVKFRPEMIDAAVEKLLADAPK